MPCLLLLSCLCLLQIRWLRAFPRLLPVHVTPHVISCTSSVSTERFSALVPCFPRLLPLVTRHARVLIATLFIGSTFSLARCWLLIFPRLFPVIYFPALVICYIFPAQVFPWLLPVTCFPGLAIGCMSSRTFFNFVLMFPALVAHLETCIPAARFPGFVIGDTYFFIDLMLYLRPGFSLPRSMSNGVL